MPQRQTKYVLTPRRLAACRANLEKGGRHGRLNGLQHGLFALDLRRSALRLGEDVQELDAYLRLFQRLFAPQDEVEQLLVRHLGETVWRWLRLHRSEARRVASSLRRVMRAARKHKCLTPDQIRARASALLMILTEDDSFRRRETRLLCGMERFVQALLRWRTGEKKANFKMFSHEHAGDITALLTAKVLTADGFVNSAGRPAPPWRPKTGPRTGWGEEMLRAMLTEDSDSEDSPDADIESLPNTQEDKTP